jgi:5-methylcytosine-specific restriction protein B
MSEAERPTTPDEDRGSPDDPEQDADWATRCRLRLHAAMALLGERDGPVSAAEIKEEAAARVPLTAYDLSTTRANDVRAWMNLFWALNIECTHAGWLHFNTSRYRLTREGRTAVTRFGPAEFWDEATARHTAWKHARDQLLPTGASDPAKTILHPGSAAAHVRRACAPLLSAWRDGDSALLPGTRLWSAETTSALAGYLQATPGVLGNELPGLAHDPARLLAAEALALLVGPFGDVPGAMKRIRVRTPLLAATTDPPGLPPPLSGDLEHGIVPGGKALVADPVGMLRSFVAILGHWWGQSPERQAEAWRDPRSWRRLLAEVGNKADNTGSADRDGQIIALLNLVAHPDAFTTLLRSEDRKLVVEAFANRLDRPTKDVDLDLFTIVLALQKEYGGRGVNLAAAPLVNVWSGRVDTGGAWLVRSQVDQRDLVGGWVANGIVSLSVGRFRQLPGRITSDSLSSLVEDVYADLPWVKREAKKRDVLAFVVGLRPGDLIATDDDGALRLARVTGGDATLQALGGSRLLTRPVSWSAERGARISELPRTIARRLRFAGGDVVNLTEILDLLEALDAGELGAAELAQTDPLAQSDPQGQAPRPAGPATLACDTVALAAALHHADAGWLDELIETLNERRQVILEGPPGTGKTQIVRKLVEACGLTPNEHTMVQFHPTYSYEDFVEGFRPTDGGDARLSVVPGPLKRLADEARAAPGRPHVLVVDEINRANLPKVFGELYFLLEYRDAEIELLYGDGKECFSLPGNLFLLGTRNSADRSSAPLDEATRRRFGFLSTGAGEPALAGVLSRWCQANSVPPGLAELRDRLNATLRERGGEEPLEFGPSYFMRPTLRDPSALRRLWLRELLPLLREHHYGDEGALASYRFSAWCAELGLAPAGAARV